LQEDVVGYRLRVEEPIAAEVTRIAQKQLSRAEHELSAAAEHFNRTRVRTARKRIKKVRALLRLVRDAMGKTYRRERRPLRRVSHQLGVLLDTGATLAVIERLRLGGGRRLAPAAAALRRSLVRQERVVDVLAGNTDALRRSARLLQAEGRRASRWTLRGKDFAAIAGGLEDTYRAGRNAMRRADLRPTARRLHTWRRRVKDQWFQLRLLAARTSGRLRRDTRVLERLDGVLGDYHDLTLLTAAIEDATSIARLERAALLRPIARERRRLRQRARALAEIVYHERPRAFVRRVEQSWSTS
jgi:CHAD domain-containing protein